jgi:hypothetical protein
MSKFEAAWLREQYIDKQRSSLDLSQECGMSFQGIIYWLNKFGIKRRTSAEASRLPASRKKNSLKNSGPDASKWRGGVKLGRDGYLRQWMPSHPCADANGYVPVHRLVVEDREHRYLRPDEIVHHINGNKRDNRADNLQIRENIEHLHEHHRKWRERLSALPDEVKE